MFGIKYIKFDSMDYIIHYRNGQVKREGKGLSFFYFAMNSSIVNIPVKSNDVVFMFTETTQDFQDITIQGQLTYNVISPKALAEQLDFTVDETKKYRTGDFEKLRQRIMNETQTAATGYVRNFTLLNILPKQSEIEKVLLNGLKSSEVLTRLGIEIQGVNILSLKATPEMSRALETKTREELQKEADKAIYDRRNFAVEQERKIKESELNTVIAIEEKQKQIVEKKMETDIVKGENERKLKEMELTTKIAIEARNTELLKVKIENERKEADAKIYVQKSLMDIYKNVDWRVLNAIYSKNTDAAENIALAFRELASNSTKIENLNITPDLLEGLVNQSKKK